MPRKFAYDYYDVAIPRDAIPEDEGEDHSELFRLAYLEADHRTRIYASPCQWDIKLRDDFDSAYFHVLVRRKRHRIKRTHFHMLVGMPGYMPDTNYTCRTRGEAEHLALWEVKNLRKGWDIDNARSHYSVSGNKHDGYDVYRRIAMYPEEVWMTISVTECFEDDCLEEMEDM